MDAVAQHASWIRDFIGPLAHSRYHADADVISEFVWALVGCVDTKIRHEWTRPSLMGSDGDSPCLSSERASVLRHTFDQVLAFGQQLRGALLSVGIESTSFSLPVPIVSLGAVSCMLEPPVVERWLHCDESFLKERKTDIFECMDKPWDPLTEDAGTRLIHHFELLFFFLHMILFLLFRRIEN